MMNIHIGNLSFNTTGDGLRAAFENFGTVTEARIIMDKATGRSKGFGFVEMEDDSEGENSSSNANQNNEGISTTVENSKS